MFNKLNFFQKLGSCCNMRNHYFTLSMLRARWCSANIRIPSLDVKVRLRKAFIVSYCKQANEIKQNSFHWKKKKRKKKRVERKSTQTKKLGRNKWLYQPICRSCTKSGQLLSGQHFTMFLSFHALSLPSLWLSNALQLCNIVTSYFIHWNYYFCKVWKCE